jgi:hypothetical protein
MIVHDCAQNTPEWLELRRGIVTASCMQQVMAKGKTPGARSETRAKYMRQLAGQIITGEVGEAWSNEHTERGHALEGEARDAYAFMEDAEPVRVGFVTTTWDGFTVGYSPDSFIGDRGGLEIKTKLPDILIECYERLAGDPPPEHVRQIQAGIEIAERDWLDLACYWPRMPLYICRVYRDESFIKEMRFATLRFNEELAAMVERIRSYEPVAIPATVAAGVGVLVHNAPAASLSGVAL